VAAALELRGSLNVQGVAVQDRDQACLDFLRARPRRVLPCEQVIGGHAERLIGAQDDHINQGGATTTQAMLDVAGRRRTPATLPGFHARRPPE
jgi:hypothetical protein